MSQPPYNPQQGQGVYPPQGYVYPPQTGHAHPPQGWVNPQAAPAAPGGHGQHPPQGWVNPQAPVQPQQPGAYPPQGAYYPPPQQGAYPQQGGQPAYPASHLAQAAQNAAFEQGKRAALEEMEHKQADEARQAAAKRATVRHYPNFRPEEDCIALRKAMKGIGSDKKVLVNIIGNRSNSQRQELIQTYKKVHAGRDLVKDLASETSGDLKELVSALMHTPASFDAHHLRKAMKGLGTDEHTLLEIICTRTPKQLEEIKKAFRAEFKRDLVKDVTSETGQMVGKSHFKNVLVGLLEGSRPEDGPIDLTQASMDAQTLHVAGERKKLGTDKDKFVKILTSRSYAHLRLVFTEYQKLSKYDIGKSITREMGKSDLALALQAIVGATRDLNEFFALQLKQSMDGMGTDERKLTRIIVSRSEIDLADIKNEFTRRNDCGEGKTLAKWIKGDVRGHYRTLLYLIMDAEMKL